MEATVHKICCVCRLDVSRLRRTKDPRGNYYCKPCYNTLLAARERRLRARAGRAAVVNGAGVSATSVTVKSGSRPPATSNFQVLSYIEPEQQATPRGNAGTSALDGAGDADLAALMRVLESQPPLEPSPALPEFQLTAMPASPYVVINDPAPDDRRGFSLGQALSKAADAISRLTRPGHETPENDAEAADAPPEPSGAIPTHVETRRAPRPRRISGKALRLSDLISAEAQAEVEAARIDPRLHEPEIPVSPITNLPVSALVDDYASLSDSRPGAADYAAGEEGRSHRFGALAFRPAPVI